MARYGLRIAILLLMVSGAAGAQCVPGGLAVVVNKSNPVDSLSITQLRKLIVGDSRTWQDKKAVALVMRDPSSKVSQCVLSAIVRLSGADYRRYVMNAEFRGEEPLAFKVANSDADAGTLVTGSEGGLAVVEANSLPVIGNAVKVVHIEGKAPGEPGYPL
jgi:ABC-type phosphate transport system substrate-binding protein